MPRSEFYQRICEATIKGRQSTAHSELLNGPSTRRGVAKLARDLVDANSILAQHGVLDAYGHVSVRNPCEPRHFLISRSLAPELVTENDIMEFDLDRNLIGADKRKPCVEMPIHSEIYKARADVMAVVHSHAPSVVASSVSTVQLRPIYHMSAFLLRGASVFDMRVHFGCTDLLVRTPEQGAALALTLGNGYVSLMRGHGFVTVAETIELAVFQAIYTGLNASLQQQAIALGGGITYLEPDEAACAWETNRGTVAKPWQLWKRKLRR
jgi:ribulose-5-phosphate 4-epimerase/fuculose-1-phosphate aldolase